LNNRVRIMDYPDIDCPRLRILHYDRTNHWYEGQLNCQQTEVRIYFATDEDGRLEFAQNKVRRFCE
jgi:hypothetical protein